MALGNIQRERKQYAECAETYSHGVGRDPDAGARQLDALLFPRHLLRALQAVAARPRPISRRRSSFIPTSRTC